jgi:drug/metabolite transporter (DMT)-like permease
MGETSSDYIKTHGLVRKYVVGVIVLALAGVASVINGDSGSVLTLKVLGAIPFAVSWICLPQLYDGVRSRTPFSPSFVERTALEGLLLGVAVVLLWWTEERQPLGILVPAAFAAIIYFIVSSLLYRLKRNG